MSDEYKVQAFVSTLGDRQNRVDAVQKAQAWINTQAAEGWHLEQYAPLSVNEVHIVMRRPINVDFVPENFHHIGTEKVRSH